MLLWNRLPLDLREASSVNVFQRKIKTFICQPLTRFCTCLHSWTFSVFCFYYNFIKWFCIYIAYFLVLMTTQSPLQYSFTFTFTFIQCIYKQHFVVLWWAIQGSASCPRTLRHADGEDWGSNCRPASWRTTALSLSHSRPINCLFVFYFTTC